MYPNSTSCSKALHTLQPHVKDNTINIQSQTPIGRHTNIQDEDTCDLNSCVMCYAERWIWDLSSRWGIGTARTRGASAAEFGSPFARREVFAVCPRPWCWSECVVWHGVSSTHICVMLCVCVKRTKVSSGNSSLGYSSMGIGGDETDTAETSGHTCAGIIRVVSQAWS